MGLKIFNVIIWTIAGVINLMNSDVSKLSYGLTWAALMIYVVGRCFEG